jgi:hypothetical protein
MALPMAGGDRDDGRLAAAGRRLVGPVQEHHPQVGEVGQPRHAVRRQGGIEDLAAAEVDGLEGW